MFMGAFASLNESQKKNKEVYHHTAQVILAHMLGGSRAGRAPWQCSASAKNRAGFRAGRTTALP